ncbi:MAG: hypothetical protein K2F87_03635 [Muribaculaceae bacterium]|nr:hypothetical protein [Muribaculaceae bacterium]
MNTDFETLAAAAANWEAMADFREARERCKRYCYGRQWDDLIEVDGRMLREEEYIRQQGNIPLKNNLIRRMVRSVLGVFRNQYSFPDERRLNLDSDSEAQHAFYLHLLDNARLNRLEELHARTMEEFLISGLAVHRKSTSGIHARRPGDRLAGMLRTDYVAPDTFFIDVATRDFRGWDVRMVGQTHDLDFRSLCSAMAMTEADCRKLRDIYLPSGSRTVMGGMSFGKGEGSAGSFLTPSAPGLCRVIEVWTREACERYRVHDRATGRLYKMEACYRDRIPSDAEVCWMLDEEWRYRYISPTGHVLAEGISPLPGGGHPYVWKAYPFIDGEIHSFVADVIDQQRHTNRLITLYDWVLRSTAKGVLLFPESALPDGVDIDDISDEWSRFNGVILFRPKVGMPLPQQVCGNASQVGITDLLNIQLKMFEDVSGVTGALEGKLTSGAVSGTLYDRQTRQAMTALLDILESYNSFVTEGALLDARLLGAPGRHFSPSPSCSWS